MVQLSSTTGASRTIATWEASGGPGFFANVRNTPAARNTISNQTRIYAGSGRSQNHETANGTAANGRMHQRTVRWVTPARARPIADSPNRRINGTPRHAIGAQTTTNSESRKSTIQSTSGGSSAKVNPCQMEKVDVTLATA